MMFNVKPQQKLKGSIFLPASKSYSIRAAIIAACGGQSTIKGMSDCDDAKVALKTAQALGARVTHDKGIWRIKALAFQPKKTFLVGESGTSLRFLLPLLPLYVDKARVEGKGTLIGRPNAHLCESLRRRGLDIQGQGPKESVPIELKGGALKPGMIKIDGSLSSQFISALMIALPRLNQDSTLMITGSKMVSKDYIVMTRQILDLAGVSIKAVSERGFKIRGNQTFKGLKNFHVPSDYGLAAFPLAAAAILPSKVVLRGHFDERLIQSDGHILGFMKKMGVVFKHTSTAITIHGPFDLKGGTFSLKDCPDLVPIMAVLALFAKGPTKLIDIHHARAKESDRISDLRVELLKVGAKVTETKGALVIDPQASYVSGKTLFAHHDHRLAMAFSVLGLRIGCQVDGIESSSKSYPSFVQDLKKISDSN